MNRKEESFNPKDAIAYDLISERIKGLVYNLNTSLKEVLSQETKKKN